MVNRIHRRFCSVNVNIHKYDVHVGLFNDDAVSTLCHSVFILYTRDEGVGEVTYNRCDLSRVRFENAVTRFSLLEIIKTDSIVINLSGSLNFPRDLTISN